MVLNQRQSTSVVISNVNASENNQAVTAQLQLTQLTNADDVSSLDELALTLLK